MKMEMNFDSIQQAALYKTIVVLYLFLTPSYKKRVIYPPGEFVRRN